MLVLAGCAPLTVPPRAREVNYALQVENHGPDTVTARVDHFYAWQGGALVLDDTFDAGTWAVEGAPLGTNCNETPHACHFQNVELDGGVLLLDVPWAEYRALFPCDLDAPCSHPVKGGESVEVEFHTVLPGTVRARVTVDFLVDRLENRVADTFNGEWVDGVGRDAVVAVP